MWAEGPSQAQLIHRPHLMLGGPPNLQGSENPCPEYLPNPPAAPLCFVELIRISEQMK